MKKIDDIEKMLPEELESAAQGEDIKVPAGLEGRIRAAIAAKEIIEPKASPVRWFPYAAVAVAAGLAVAVVVPQLGQDKLKDTYDDPYLAYAQVEAAFQRISDKMAIGVDMAEKAGQAAEKPLEVINKIK